MVSIEINNEEIQALDIVLGKVEVKPIIGYKLATLRIKIQNALMQEQKKTVKKKTKEITNVGKDDKNRKTK